MTGLDPTLIQCDFGEWNDQQCPRVAERLLMVECSPPGTGATHEIIWRLCAGHAKTMQERIEEDPDEVLVSDEPLA